MNVLTSAATGLMESLQGNLSAHWDHEPTPNPSQEGNSQGADERLVPSWEGSAVGPRLIKEGARTALSARYFGEIIETPGHGCPRSVREILQSAEGVGRFMESRNGSALHRGFTLIEMIGVLAVIAILVAAVVPTIIRRVDQATWTKETADLNTIADAYTKYILRNKVVPGTNDWAPDIANQMSLPVSAITTNARRFARAFLIDPNLRINGAVLPYSQQTSNGTTNVTSARVMIVSSLSLALPISTSVPTSAEFNAIWNTADGAKPTTATWTTWAGTGADLRIKKLNLEPLFYQLILVNKDTASVPYFSIDSTNTTSLPASPLGWNKYYLDGTVLGLHDTNSVVQTRHLLKRSISFMFESGSWHGQVQGDQQSYSASGSDFYNHAVTFITRPTNPWGPQAHGTSQWGVIVALYTFMFDYTFWANECPYHFPNYGNNPNSVPEYVLLDNQGQPSTGNIDQFTSQLLTHP